MNLIKQVQVQIRIIEVLDKRGSDNRGSTVIIFISKPCTFLIVSAHRRILGMASVVHVLVKICVSSISLYKLDTDKLTAPFESAHQFTRVCTVSDSKTVPGCHYHPCSKSQFYFVLFCESFESVAVTIGTLPRCWTLPP